MALTYFPVTATLKAVVSDSSADIEGDPDIQNISCFVYFTPSVWEITDATTIYELAQIRARTNPDDGILKNIDGTTVHLVANTPNLGLDDLIYTVTFDHVVYNNAKQTIRAFKFAAPYNDASIDLSTVERLPLK